MRSVLLFTLLFWAIKGSSEYSEESTELYESSSDVMDRDWLYVASVSPVFLKEDVKLCHGHSSSSFTVNQPGVKHRLYVVGTIAGSKIDFHLAKDGCELHYLYSQEEHMRFVRVYDQEIDFWRFPGFLLLLHSDFTLSSHSLSFHTLLFRLQNELPLGRLPSTVLAILQVTLTQTSGINYSL